MHGVNKVCRMVLHIAMIYGSVITTRYDGSIICVQVVNDAAPCEHDEEKYIEGITKKVLF